MLVRGAGDLGSGVAFRLFKSGYWVIMTELPRPLLVRRAVSFGNAVFQDDGVMTVEDVMARLADAELAVSLLKQGDEIPVVIDNGDEWRKIKPTVVVDARMAKRNIDTSINDAELVIGLGPGFNAGLDCHAVIETNRGHRLGRVIWQGTAEPNTGVPGNVLGKSAHRVLRAPQDGFVRPERHIGDSVEAGEIIGRVGEEVMVAPFDGVLRGLIHESVAVKAGMKVGDVDPRGERANCFLISEKSLAIGGAVLEALLNQGKLPANPIDRVQEQYDATM